MFLWLFNIYYDIINVLEKLKLNRKDIYMRIGVDLDGVVFDTEKSYRTYSELYDILKLKQNSKINNKELLLQKRFNWTNEQIDDFFRKYDEEIISTGNLMPGAKIVLNKLKEDGHKLFVISARGEVKFGLDGIEFDSASITDKMIKENGIDVFEKCYYKVKDKAKICIDEKIDIMIDDAYTNCLKLADSKIKTIYLKEAPSYDIVDNDYVITLYNWGEIYRYIYENS